VKKNSLSIPEKNLAKNRSYIDVTASKLNMKDSKEKTSTGKFENRNLTDPPATNSDVSKKDDSSNDIQKGSPDDKTKLSMIETHEKSQTSSYVSK